MPRVFVLHLIVWAAILAGPAAAFKFCANGTAVVTCLVENEVIVLDGPVNFVSNASFVFINSNITARPCTGDPCRESTVSLTSLFGNITFMNSSLTAAVVSFEAVQVSIDNTSLILASGRGPPITSTPFADGVLGTGGGHGGSGAPIYLCRQGIAPDPSIRNGQGFGFGSLADPASFGGASAGFQDFNDEFREISRGGGKVSLTAIESVSLAGRIEVDGASGLSDTVHCLGNCRGACGCGPGGGAGGSVLLFAPLISIAEEQGFISAVGGGSEDSGGGGGGVIAFVGAVVRGASSVRLELSRRICGPCAPMHSLCLISLYCRRIAGRRQRDRRHVDDQRRGDGLRRRRHGRLARQPGPGARATEVYGGRTQRRHRTLRRRFCRYCCCCFCRRRC